MGSTIPAPGSLKNGSNTFRKKPFTPPPATCDNVACILNCP